MSGDMSASMTHLPAIGELLSVALPDKGFSGRVTEKMTEYTETDMDGNRWDWVTRVFVTLDLSARHTVPNGAPFLIKR